MPDHTRQKCLNQNVPVTDSGHTDDQSILQFDLLTVMPDLAHPNIEPQFLPFLKIYASKNQNASAIYSRDTVDQRIMQSD